ncbi:DNA polymerase III tau subunit [Planifilum fimeticola]|uniref:DNA-directed DNA polymerase n=1 Tax=Planifilum fimeticola TaxID=201975 RepID=A0A2T0LIC8_9BACL|nr:DNA polymerase III subunit gamma/tau [Planifilum fimeticola]PRX42168.1 DNA polymerase III tau subunit [Planifilum fimeticola]
MTYRALYRVWRSQSFADLVGQEHVTRTLKNALKEKRFSHAYLFSGPRGTGKTSTAKIFAKAVNCLEGPAPEPCNRCEPCRRIAEGSLMDVVEIDAASNRGVDEIRDLRDKVKFAPTEVRYKVYIVDEVHMLTTEAFNALLKTLEEPPDHVIFILATTEPHKLPQTIRSRCQHFPFHRISFREIVRHLRRICDAQSVEVDEAALATIARAADGGMRDALSLLDQVLAYADGRVEESTVLAVTGFTSRSTLAELWKGLAEGDAQTVLDRVDGLIREGTEPQRLIDDMIDSGRDLLLLRTAPNLPDLRDRIGGDESWERLADRFSPGMLNRMLEVLIQAAQKMKWTPHARVVLEMAVVELCHPAAAEQAAAREMARAEAAPPTEALGERIRLLERKIKELEKAAFHPGSASGGAAAPPSERPAPSSGRQPAGEGKSFRDIDPKRTEEVRRHWPEVLARVKEQKITVHAWLIDGEPVAATQDAVIVAFKNSIHRETTEKESHKSLIEKVMAEVLGSPLRLITVMRDEWQEFGDQPSGGREEESAPSPSKKEGSAEGEDMVRQAVEIFGKDLVEITD